MMSILANSKIFFFIKFSFFLVLFSFSIYFFYVGFNSLQNYESFSNLDLSNIETIKSNKINKNSEKKLLIQNQKIEEEIYDDEIEDTAEKEIIIKVKKNDTFSKLIDPYAKNNKQKNKIISVIQNKYDLKYLKVNQNIFLYIKDNEEISKIIIPIDFDTDLVLYIGDNDIYEINEEKLLLKKQYNSASFEILTSLYNEGREAGLPLTILSEVIRLFSFDIDFQRDIRKGNRLEVYYESFYNESRRTVSYGKVYYINLIFDKNNLEYFLFKDMDGIEDYFNKEGKNVKKALMKTPIDGAKLSSNFGMRKHPILGYNKFHKGVDFAAPKGTPIFAAGNGVVEFAGNNGSYGKYIRIRHNGSYKTAYAHLNNFRKGIGTGSRVNQGDIIGYVGSTGRSTGPHLHYEIIYQNKQINPLTLKLPSGKKLKGEELDQFTKISQEIYSDYLFYLYE